MTEFTNWRKAAKSNGSGTACVEVGHASDRAGVRDTKLGASSPVLDFSSTAFERFVSRIKSGAYDV